MMRGATSRSSGSWTSGDVNYFALVDDFKGYGNEGKLTFGSMIANTVSSQARRSIMLFSREEVTAAPTERTTSSGRCWR